MTVLIIDEWELVFNEEHEDGFEVIDVLNDFNTKIVYESPKSLTQEEINYIRAMKGE
jgi:hypothetical protein